MPRGGHTWWGTMPSLPGPGPLGAIPCPCSDARTGRAKPSTSLTRPAPRYDSGMPRRAEGPCKRRQLVKNDARVLKKKKGGGQLPFALGFFFSFFLSLRPGTHLRRPTPTLRIPAAQRAEQAYLKRPCGEGVPPHARCAGLDFPSLRHSWRCPPSAGVAGSQGSTLHPMIPCRPGHAGHATHAPGAPLTRRGAGGRRGPESGATWCRWSEKKKGGSAPFNWGFLFFLFFFSCPCGPGPTSARPRKTGSARDAGAPLSFFGARAGAPARSSFYDMLPRVEC